MRKSAKYAAVREKTRTALFIVHKKMGLISTFGIQKDTLGVLKKAFKYSIIFMLAEFQTIFHRNLCI